MKYAVVLFPLLLGSLCAQEMARGRLFDNVIEALDDRLHDRSFVRGRLPDLARAGRRLARQAESLDEERRVVHAVLSQIPASHLAILSRHGWAMLEHDLDADPAPTFGFQLAQWKAGSYYVDRLIPFGPAHRRGVVRGDRIVEIDGVPVAESTRLDWRTDDAHLTDPPFHYVKCKNGDSVRLTVESKPGERFHIEVEAERDSPWAGDWRAVRTYELMGRTIGYFSTAYIYTRGMRELLDHAFEEVEGCDALVVDLRGRGGSEAAARYMARRLSTRRESWSGRLYCVVDRTTRSAKELIAHELRRNGSATLVGERTAGAVRPTSFVRVGPQSVLMMPAGDGSVDHTDPIELIGVPPHVAVKDDPTQTDGEDVILVAALARAAGRRVERETGTTVE